MFRKWVYLTFVIAVVLGWVFYVYLCDHSLTEVFSFAWPMSCTMILGAFIAGASSEGGGAIAFPVMTLLLGLSAPEARIFSLAIQSFGMTAASILIYSKRIPILNKSILPVSFAGIAGFVLCDVYLLPLIPSAPTKIYFVSLWLSFGLALWLVNKNKTRIRRESLSNISRKDFSLMFVFALIGGAVSAIFGNGIDIVTFTLFTLHFKINEKVATPNSVVLMTVMTVFGFLWHLLFRNDIPESVSYYLLGTIPIVIFMAPFGAWVISKVSRSWITGFLYFVISAQFITAFIVVNPSYDIILESLVIIAIGSLIFLSLAGVRRLRN